jgi:CheY-like chemotaxis protein
MAAMLPQTKHVLIVDNDIDVRDSVSFSLRAAGYGTFCAASAVEARTVLQREIVHVAIIDIRLDDDKLASDSTGFELARDIAHEIPIVIFTAYEDIDNVRRAYSEVKAKEILSKKDAGAAVKLCELVTRLFTNEVKTNFSLGIDTTLSPNLIAAKIELPETDQAAARPSADDIEQILRTLFYPAEAINVSSLLPEEQAPSISQGGSLVALVTPRLTHGWGASKVVKFGARIDIEQEAERYALFKDYPHGQRMPRLDSTAYARQIGGLTYSLIDGTETGQQLSVFAQYYEKHSAKEVNAVLSPFFRQTFGTLYSDTHFGFADLPAEYAASLRLTPDKLLQAMAELRPQEPAAPRLWFAGLPDDYMNPYCFAVHDGTFFSSPVLVSKSLCHGDLHGRNILVDQERHFWLIDFARVEESHALRDFAELESDIKFALLPVTDLEALFEFERSLLVPAAMNSRVPHVSFADQRLAKAHAVITALRKLAFDLVRFRWDMQEYYLAEFMHTLKVLRLRHIDRAKKEHALLSAALHSERLANWPDPPAWLAVRQKTPPVRSGPDMPAYQDFEVLVTTDRRIRASSAQGEVWDELQLDAGALDPDLTLLEASQTNAEQLRRIGSTLYSALFPNQIHGLLRATQGGAEARNRGVRLRLNIDLPELAALPWELLYDASTKTFLASDTQTVLSRYVDVPQHRKELRTTAGPIKVLLVISSPSDCTPLDAAREVQLIRSALSPHVASGQVELDVVDDATVHNLTQQLRIKPYNVFHFIGHGDFINDHGTIALVEKDGLARWMHEEAFANLLLGMQQRSLGLAVLNSCHSASSSSFRAMSGVALHLVQRALPAVISMQYRIQDTTAVQFAGEFYSALALGWPVDAAIQSTRNAISLEVGMHLPDFATPVLHMRAQDGVILQPALP